MADQVANNLDDKLDQQLNLKQRSDIHWARKIWHMASVFVMFAIYRVVPNSYSLTILMVSWCLFVPLDFYRHRNSALNDFLIHFFRPILRTGEVNKLAGTSYLLTGVLAVTLLLPRPVVSVTLLFLAFADPLASYVGIRYGKDKILGQKTIQGFMAAYVVCFLCSFIFLYSTTIPSGRLFAFCLLSGLVGALAELVPIGKLDDNLTLPILSGTGMYALYYVFGFLENLS